MTTYPVAGGSAVPVVPQAAPHPAADAQRTRGVPRRWSPVLASAGEALPALIWIAIAVGGLLVFRLWWTSTPNVADNTGDVLTNVGRLLGLTAGYLCPVQLLLMARIPVFETVAGTHQLAVWHGRIGRYLINALLGHVVFIILGYAAAAHRNVFRQTLDLEQQYPDVLMSSLAFVMLVGVGITSARAARRRLKYETWYLLHLYTYLAIGLAFAHQFATGEQFISNATARHWWAALYLTSVGLLLWFRLFVPVRTFWRHRLTVSSVTRESRDVVSVTLSGIDLGGLRAQPGQYLRLRFLTSTGWWQSHPFSLSSIPTADALRVTIKDRGDHTASLESSLRQGVRILVEGPYGALTERRRARDKVLLVAGGIGITPLRALFESLHGDPGDVTLIYRSHSYEDLVFRDELDELSYRRGFAIRYLVGPRDGAGALTAEVLRSIVPDVADRDCYLCGPLGLEELVTQELRASGVPTARIHSEQFDY